MTKLIELEQIRDLLVEQIITNLETEPESQEISTQELEGFLSQLEAEIADKVDAIAATIAAKNGEIAYLKERRDYFDRLIKSRQNALDRFKDYIKSILSNRKDTTICGKESKLKVVANGGKQPVWINPDLKPQELPAELTETVCTISSTAIRQRLSQLAGEELIIGDKVVAKLEPKGTHLRIG
jgi:Siphovirus Gp157